MVTRDVLALHHHLQGAARSYQADVAEENRSRSAWIQWRFSACILPLSLVFFNEKMHFRKKGKRRGSPFFGQFN